MNNGEQARANIPHEYLSDKPNRTYRRPMLAISVDTGERPPSASPLYAKQADSRRLWINQPQSAVCRAMAASGHVR